VLSEFPADKRPFLNLNEAATFVGLKPPTLRRAIRHGHLAYAKPGRAYLVRPSDVTSWLESELRRGGARIKQ
jgi:excisionase family DNA binding protein